MEEVDKILIHSLRLSGTDIPDEVQSIREFTTELIVESVVRCLRVISPSVGAGLSHILPPGMSARFRIGMSLAQACQDLGYQGEVGYQTFLYSSEPEIRRLLLFLVEKLPRDASEDADQPVGKSTTLHKAIAAAIKEQLAIPWVPPACRTRRLQLLQGSCLLKRFQAQPLVLPRESDPILGRVSQERKEFFDKFLPPVSAQLSRPTSLVPSLLELNMAELSTAQEWENEWKSQGLGSRMTPEEYRQWKHQRLQRRLLDQLRQTVPRVGPAHLGTTSGDLIQLLGTFGTGHEHAGALAKGSRFTHSQHLAYKQEAETPVQVQTLPISRSSEQELREHQAAELEALESELDRLGGQITELESQMSTLGLTLTQVEGEVRQGQLGVTEQEQVLRVKGQTVELLPDAENNMAKLQVVVESSAKRVIQLAAQWEKHRVPLIQEFRDLKALHDSKELESSQRLSEIRELHDRIRSAADEAKHKDDLYKQLVMELESLPKDVSRSAYTQRILEIVSNIRKQKEEITKILSDTKELQKEINGLTGKLDRTFAVTDELVFKDAKRDEAVRKAYKYLAALHENCSQLIQTIEDTGTILREIRDLEEQIESETSKKTLSNLERILVDYRAMKQENAVLLSHSQDT
ncbi:coiled-coil domain-containing protein 22 isoform X1 [Sceloporus undulatus]|uniref:coiled-coil domain-containing protein 22 isoform X1 n=1 Tax=Sceloporus undulatus TaxID=8520 RepID=UPI001C4BCA90|nr:coiled-coil domain-containing protein 22 isoform X1 [Sceloporus undulatus]XP_042308346.1 coiled-coil domain-containing protein 22 isoform X1 [Sceloporus undulatus]